MAKSVEQTFNKYRRNLTAAVGDMEYGAKNTSKSQTKNAIKQKQLMIDNHAKAIQSGKWERGLTEAGDAKWERNYVEKGLPKIGLGIDANADEIKAKFSAVIDNGERVSAEVAKMPKGGLNNAAARAMKAWQMTQDYWGKK